jgi:tRNA uridine 5-carboxymethylaminomethyl modification enzyme
LISPARYKYFQKKQAAVARGRVISPETKEQIAIEQKYAGYIRRQQEQIERFKKLEHKKLPPGLDYQKLHGLSNEAKVKLAKLRPLSVGQAGRIAGVSPADVAVLLVHLEVGRRSRPAVVE